MAPDVQPENAAEFPGRRYCNAIRKYNQPGAGLEADGPRAIPLLDGIETRSVIADKGYESNRILGYVRSKGTHGGYTG